MKNNLYKISRENNKKRINEGKKKRIKIHISVLVELYLVLDKSDTLSLSQFLCLFFSLFSYFCQTQF